MGFMESYSKIVVDNHAAVVAKIEVYATKDKERRVYQSKSTSVGVGVTINLNNLGLEVGEQLYLKANVVEGKDCETGEFAFEKDGVKTLSAELKGTTFNPHFIIR
jgi:hypothetical protein